jgi:hypothetical protein
MWPLVLAMTLNISACEQELGNTAIAKRICRIPDITMSEAREMLHLQVACDAIKKAVESTGRTYKWVELKGNDGYEGRCYIDGY